MVTHPVKPAGAPPFGRLSHAADPFGSRFSVLQAPTT